MIRPILFLLMLGACALAQSQTVPATGKFPALNIQVTVGTAQRNEKNSFYRKTMTISPKATVEGSSRMLPIPAAEATVLIITMDTRAKYTKGEESYKVYAKQTLPVPAVQTGEKRTFTYDESTMTFDAYRDSTNVGGDVYKYYVFGLVDPATKTVVDFRTNNAQLQTYIKAHPEKREELLGLAKNARFPADFK